MGPGMPVGVLLTPDIEGAVDLRRGESESITQRVHSPQQDMGLVEVRGGLRCTQLVDKMGWRCSKTQVFAGDPSVCTHVWHGYEHSAANAHGAQPVAQRDADVGHVLEDVIGDEKVEVAVGNAREGLRIVN